MSTKHPGTEEQIQEYERRVKALKRRFRLFKNRVSPRIGLQDIAYATKLSTGFISNLVNGGIPFTQPGARKNLVKIIYVFAQKKAIRSLAEANEFLREVGFEELDRNRDEDWLVIDHFTNVVEGS